MAMDEMQRAARSIKELESYILKLKKLSTKFKVQYSLAEHYLHDAKHYYEKGDYFTSFGCSDYAYGLLDSINLVNKHQVFPEPTAGAIIVDENNNIFLMKSHKWKDKYTIPGGHVELGETIEQALKREIKEETNLDIFDIRHLITQEFIHGPEFWDKRHFIFFDYVCRTKNPNQVRLNDEAQEYGWFSKKKIMEMAEKGMIDKYTLNAINIWFSTQTPA